MAPSFTPTTEDESALVRKCLRYFAKELQKAGEIPPDISEFELYSEVERHVPTILAAAQRNAMYHEWMANGHLEDHIRHLVQLTFKMPPQSPPAVAKDSGVLDYWSAFGRAVFAH